MASTIPWRAQAGGAARSPALSTRDKEEWEDWEDEDACSQLDDTAEEVLITFSPDPSRVSKSTTRTTQTRQSVQRLTRLKSRQRQKAQNAKAGIKVVTDMSKFRRQPQGSQQLKSAGGSIVDANGKFVDATALRALEGDPTSASIGSFAWLKRKPTNLRDRFNKKHNRTPTGQDLSPAARPIVIGFAVPEDSLSEHQFSPQTAIIETPDDLQRVFPPGSTKSTKTVTPLTPSQQRSVWSPDTEASISPHYSARAASSIYSQPSMYGASVGPGYVPPVPALPAHLTGQTITRIEAEEEDVDTPCTEFEEDGSPIARRKSSKATALVMSPQSAQSAGGRSQGWWDTVTTPFTTQNSPLATIAQQRETNPSNEVQDWWDSTDKKKPASPIPINQVQTTASTSRGALPQPTGTSANQPSLTSVTSRQESHSEKAQILIEENETPSEQPPPYSPPTRSNAVKYGAILPPGHSPSLASLAQPLPSPGPVSPGLPGTMTSQGAINMLDIPLTPPARRVNLNSAYPNLPQRPTGTYLPPGGHFQEATGPGNRVERTRRRHEKEDVIARKAGGFWRGRGCIPEEGCLGRTKTGREGRKRRRICLGIFGSIIAALILIVVLAVTLTRKAVTSTPAEKTIWLNLTDFPPMPTGVLTVMGPDNPTAVTGCITPSTLWTCSLPKEQQAENLPYQPNQPKFIFQVQYDNSTRQLWKVTDSGEQPPQASSQTSAKKDGQDNQQMPAPSRRSIASAAAFASNFIRSLVTAPGISPNPEPPKTKEIYFLGNTTDGIVSDNKAGEPTPFYISLLQSLNQTVGSNMVTKRGINNGIDAAPDNGSTFWNISNLLPDPVLNPDGTGAPSKLFPHPVQQPVRLFDRGLPTEHYGFYSYYDKTIYVKAVDTPQNEAVVPDDMNGGTRQDSAKYIVTWVSSRFLVKIWTRMGNTTQLLGNTAGDGADVNTQVTRPGTMPWPVTITLDTHGGDKNTKTTFYYGVDDRGHIDRGNAKLLLNFMNVGGTQINAMGLNPDDSLGGYDGGTGGCKCEWVNFKGRNPGRSQ